jgi:MOSC domain
MPGDDRAVEYVTTADAIRHLTTAELQAGIDEIRKSPADRGRLELIVSRPAVDERELLAEATLDVTVGLVGDTWLVRGSKHTVDGKSNPEAQITVMNVRAAQLVADDPDRRMLCGDQLYVDLDLSPANLPIGTRLAIGSAVIEVSTKPHLGCEKFSARFGEEAWRFVNSRVGREYRLRGLNARVITSGTVRLHDIVRKMPASS